MRPKATNLPRETRVHTRVPSSLPEASSGSMANSPLFGEGRASRFSESTLSICRTISTPRLTGVRKAAHCLTGAALSFVLAVLDSATTPVLSPIPWPYSSRCQSSCRRGITRTSSAAWGAHWRLEPFGMGVKWAVLEDAGVLLPAMSPSCRRLISSRRVRFCGSLCKHDRARS